MKNYSIMTICMTSALIFGMFIWSVLDNDKTVSVSERRPLEQMQKADMHSVASGEWMQNFETYALDQIPCRDSFRTLKAMTSFYIFRQKDNHGIYLCQGYASKLDYPENEQSLQYAADRFTLIYDKFLKDKPVAVYFSVIPDKNYFIAEQNGYPSIDYDHFCSVMQEKINFAKYISIMDDLALSDYYRTDIHWRQEKILDTAKNIADQMGVPLTEEYQSIKVATPFYGVLFGQSALPLSADEMYYMDAPYLHECTVFDYETNTTIPVYDIDKTTGNDPYEMFLSGSKSLLVIENPTASTTKELICFRDSFGSSLAPLLAEGYQKITLVDIRYISPALLGQFIDFNHQDVLFLYSTSVLNNSETMK